MLMESKFSKKNPIADEEIQWKLHVAEGLRDVKSNTKLV